MGEAKNKRMHYEELQRILDSGKNDKIRDAVEEITKYLVDSGMLIEAGFVTLRAQAIPDDAPEDQIICMREAFFAGAQHLLGSIMTFLDEGDDEPTEKDMERMDKVHEELQRFLQEYKLKHTEAEGRA